MEENKNLEVQDKEYVSPYRPFFSFFSDPFSDDDVMKTDIVDEGENYKVLIEIPGVEKKDIKLSLDKGYLTVTAKVNTNSSSGKGKYIHTERFSGTYKRSFDVGNRVTKENIQANLENGILIVTINKPKKEQDAEKFIEIQ